MKLEPFRGIFGLPPSTYISDDMVMNSMPIMEIEPGIPKFEEGLNLFGIEPAFDVYAKTLSNHGYEIDTGTTIKAACIADNFPTDTFTNDYGETFLQKFTDVSSEAIGQITQMTGSTQLVGNNGAIGKLATFTQGLGVGAEEAGSETLGGMLSGAGNAAVAANQYIQKMIDNASSNPAMAGSIQTLNKMLGGQRVDFPMVWKNSAYTPSYSATIRLYNPNPGSLSSTNKYIVGPLAVFLCLALPRSDNGTTYNYPFFHRIKTQGLYRLDPAVITNITVVKGGDQQQVAFTKQLGIVDIRLDFTSLYVTMVAESQDSNAAYRPTLKKYLEAINLRGSEYFYKRSHIVKTQKTYAGLYSTEPVLMAANQTDSETLNQEQLIAKNEAGQRRQSPTAQEVSTEGRVSSDIKSIESNLRPNMPSIV